MPISHSPQCNMWSKWLRTTRTLNHLYEILYRLTMRMTLRTWLHATPRWEWSCLSTFDFHKTVSHEHASAQSRPNVWRANIQDIMHSGSLIDYTIDPESSFKTAWDTFRNPYLKVNSPHTPWTTPRGPKTPHHGSVVRFLSFFAREEKCGIDLGYQGVMRKNLSI